MVRRGSGVRVPASALGNRCISLFFRSGAACGGVWNVGRGSAFESPRRLSHKDLQIRRSASPARGAAGHDERVGVQIGVKMAQPVATGDAPNSSFTFPAEPEPEQRRSRTPPWELASNDAKTARGGQFGVGHRRHCPLRGEEAMRKFISSLLVLAAVLFAIAATPAAADVHGVSQAGCAAPGAPSGATTDASRSAPGRPDAPIPVTASDGRTQGRGGAADAQGTNC